jgi:uncharacterized protein (TIGR03435 family)
MRLNRIGLALGCIMPVGLHPQTLPPAPQYRFEVASIRPSQPGAEPGGMAPGPQGGFRATNMTVLELITYAYHLRNEQVAGAPKWTTTERFSISATPDRPEPLHPGMKPAEFEEHHRRQRQRMQALLKDRFGLVLRSETKDLTVYTLNVAKGGVKMIAKPEPTGAPTIRMPNGRMSGTSVGMPLLTQALTRAVGREVADQTGLTGYYDFDMTWTPDTAAEEPGPSIFAAIQEQLGLRLDARKAPVPFLVVEFVERPSEN